MNVVYELKILYNNPKYVIGPECLRAQPKRAI